LNEQKAELENEKSDLENGVSSLKQNIEEAKGTANEIKNFFDNILESEGPQQGRDLFNKMQDELNECQ
jgi:hypothetical protein